MIRSDLIGKKMAVEAGAVVLLKTHPGTEFEVRGVMNGYASLQEKERGLTVFRDDPSISFQSESLCVLNGMMFLREMVVVEINGNLLRLRQKPIEMTCMLGDPNLIVVV